MCASPQAAYTVVNGKTVVRQGRLITIDVEPLVEQHNRLASKHEIEKWSGPIKAFGIRADQ